jgi:hypothetical protein
MGANPVERVFSPSLDGAPSGFLLPLAIACTIQFPSAPQGVRWRRMLVARSVSRAAFAVALLDPVSSRV